MKSAIQTLRNSIDAEGELQDSLSRRIAEALADARNLKERFDASQVRQAEALKGVSVLDAIQAAGLTP